MQEANLPIIANEECKGRYRDAGHNLYISNNMICAGYKKGGKGTCQVRCLKHFFRIFQVKDEPLNICCSSWLTRNLYRIHQIVHGS